ncbi:MAG: DUF169 domain-containing protein [Anaerolineae bacterium]|jgi:hypothetical protein|nr:DUF169 domain-containing protein [Anaerolineae bacterium]
MSAMDSSPNPTELLRIAGIGTPLIGFYDVPEPEPFAPFASPQHCIFPAYPAWQKGESVLITKEAFSCGGAGYWLCGVESRSREQFVDFLYAKEGLKASRELMQQWLEEHPPYQQQYPTIVIGPLRKDQYRHLRTVTFFVNPDQLSLLATAAEYHHAARECTPVLTRFGSGCSQLAALFDDLDAPQALIGALDIAMRQHLPPDILAFTVTKSMFEQLCEVTDDSFFYKPFWKRLQRTRANIKLERESKTSS